MEERDHALLQKYLEQDAELKALWEEHQLFEQQLEKLEKKGYLSPSEDRVVKEIKKKKLNGKTKMQAILDRYKALEA